MTIQASPSRLAGLLASARLAAGLFTVIPVPAGSPLRRGEAARALLWLPVIGVLAAAPAAGVLLAAEGSGHATPRRLLAAALAVAVIAAVTGGLHWDGLADTADGLASRRPPAQALDIMRRSDIGPFGVLVLALVLVVEITALAALPPGWHAGLGLAVAAVTGRAAVVLAAGRGSPAARPEGFGALVAGTATAPAQAATLGAVLAATAAAGAATGGPAGALRFLAAGLTALLAAGLVRWAALRRLGGMTGDVYGALIEVTAATVLLVLALAT